jgi:rhodanese-related sulfurtransferase
VSLARLLDEATRKIKRYTPVEARRAASEDGRIVDIRSHDSRARDGVIPGSLHFPRTVLEWRVALDSDWRSPEIGGTEELLILVCDQGYSSILAAATLVDLGFARTGDLIGGFEAWRSQGLPVDKA